MNIQIIPMEQCHIDMAYEIEISCFPDDPWPKEWLTRDFKGSTNIHQAAYVDDIMAGFTCLYLNDGCMTIGNMAVAPVFRRQGIGGALMKKAIEIAKENGAKSVKLEVSAHNIAAQALYIGHGFAAKAVIKEYYNNGEDALVMRKYI